ncbi:hypothetical protein PDESU_02606 [Pontiella desulfatans]|uniref:Uncharacterized protein n=1 Tax=Pontiella desulfatans TaxID=2750659 RepID=A0A6C2U2N1_PONDE|nr:hypothetical protein PDESU_02606 [Pontiella desulfatans]
MGAEKYRTKIDNKNRCETSDIELKIWETERKS